MASRVRFIRRALPLLILVWVVAGCGTTEVAGGVDPAADAAADDLEHDHSDASRVREWDTNTVPNLDISVTVDEAGGHVLVVEAPGFTFTGADVFDPVPGEGHAHLYVAGELMTMIYASEFRLPQLVPGTYQLMVTLSTNDHLEYTVGGELLSTMTTLVIEDAKEDQTPDSTATTGSERIEITVEVHDGTVSTRSDQIAVDLGLTVVLTVTSDIADEVHIHGYDRRIELNPGELVSIEFVADIPGVFEVELEGSHLHVIQLQVS
jgi:hypothetical protein